MILFISPNSVFTNAIQAVVGEGVAWQVENLKVVNGAVASAAAGDAPDGTLMLAGEIGIITFPPKFASEFAAHIGTSILASKYLNVGVCGSLTPGLVSGEVFEATAVMKLGETAVVPVGRSGIYSNVCSVVTSDSFIEPEAKMALQGALGAGAGNVWVADMLLSILRQHIPSVESIKIIGDSNEQGRAGFQSVLPSILQNEFQVVIREVLDNE